ncbi:MAG: YdeI/OmpD-associated family protein [Saprospiraceae bacterium]|jgi:uncharacterized protein YdeI (YjbR/CyaY-like superfamily)|nr:YdeI/OmpD-associated family protein [Saprospiraceae bacterium]
MSPIFFSHQSAFRTWLEANHDQATELLVGYYKVASGKPSMTWSESVDQALCFGWIDGIRRSIDEESYCIRFTPRKPRSIWSAVNIKKVEELTQQGLMRPAGIAAFAKRSAANSEIYSYENELNTFEIEMEEAFKADEKAWEFFQSQAPYYKKAAINWVMSAKQAVTRQKRLEELIADSTAGLKIKQLRR